LVSGCSCRVCSRNEAIEGLVTQSASGLVVDWAREE
jgi:hypothetical protein